MSIIATTGAMCMCTCGSRPTTFRAMQSLNLCNNLPIGTIFDNIPGLNFSTFGTCSILSGAPCTPATPSPWMLVTPNLITIANKPMLTVDSKLICAIGGIIQFVIPAEATCVVS